MTATNNSGAVFFLGTRAHYQVLTPPDSDNGNDASTESIYQKPSNIDLYQTTDNGVVDKINANESDFNFRVVRRRLRKNRKQDGSSEMILNDNDFESTDNISDEKRKSKRVGCPSINYLLNNLAILRKKKERCYADAYTICTMRNSCRCDDCQSRYFDCYESEDEYSMQDECELSAVEYAEHEEVRESDESAAEEEDDEVSSAGSPAPPAAASPEESEMAVELAAGAPLFMELLLTHPFTCSIQ